MITEYIKDVTVYTYKNKNEFLCLRKTYKKNYILYPLPKLNDYLG